MSPRSEWFLTVIYLRSGHVLEFEVEHGLTITRPPGRPTELARISWDGEIHPRIRHLEVEQIVAITSEPIAGPSARTYGALDRSGPEASPA